MVNLGKDREKFEQFMMPLAGTCIYTEVQINKDANIFLSTGFNICFGYQKNGLIETVLLSTHNICFG